MRSRIIIYETRGDRNGGDARARESTEERGKGGARMADSETGDARRGARRIRITIPDDDKICCAWFDAQHDKSMSMRKLILDSVDRRGIADMFATELPEGRVRRTRKQIMNDRADELVRKARMDEAAPAPAEPDRERLTRPAPSRMAPVGTDIAADLSQFRGMMDT